MWFIFCVNTLLRTKPHRFGTTFSVYLDTAARFWTEKPIYDLSQIGDYLYWPVSLLIFGPIYKLDHTTAALIGIVVSLAVLSWASVSLIKALFPERSVIEVMNLSGVLLMINIPAAWQNVKFVQAQIAMTAAMMLAAAAMMRRHWLTAAFWLFISVVTKPLSLVMLLLCAATQSRMRLALAAALIAALLLPFAFADASYLSGEYRAWITKLGLLTVASPAQWPFQADFVTMLDSFGIVLPRPLATAIRLFAALGTLGLAWRIARTQDSTVCAMSVTLLSACFITLFGPRNEYLSFLVLTPPLTALALVLVMRDIRDQRAWCLIAVALVVGFHWSLNIDRVLKPTLTLAFFAWLIWLTIKPERWRELFQPTVAAGQEPAGPDSRSAA